MLQRKGLSFHKGNACLAGQSIALTVKTIMYELFKKVPFARLLASLLAGITLGLYCPVNIHLAMGLLGLLCVVYTALVVVHTLSPQLDREGVWVGSIGLLSLTAVGYVRVIQQDPMHYRDHLIHHAPQVKAYSGSVLQSRTHGAYTYLVLAVQKAQLGHTWQGVQGKVGVWVGTQKSLSPVYRYGDQLTIQGALHPIQGRKNPYTFDYKAFAQARGITHQGFSTHEKVDMSRYAPVSKVIAATYRLRSLLAGLLTAPVQGEAEKGIALALLLGIREKLPAAVVASFSAAGTLHILAVSGLHVGILYAILLLLLGLAGARHHRRKWLQAIVLLPTLWGYALLTALSPSVVRATTMLSLFTLAKLLYQRYSLWNGLATTAYAGLLLRPLWIQEVSFQLSYLALVGIAGLYPMLVKKVSPRSWLGKKLWQMTAASLAVQLTTLPLSLYYFHYLPTYFLLGNWVCVPLASCIAALGLTTCLTATIPYVGTWLGALFSYLLHATYHYVKAVEKLPYSKLGPIWWSIKELWMVYAIVAGALFFFSRKKIRYLSIATAAALLFAAGTYRRWWEQGKQQSIIVYRLPHQAALACIERRAALLFSNRHIDTHIYAREIAPSMHARGIRKVTSHTLTHAEKATAAHRYIVWKGLQIILWKKKSIVFLGSGCHIPPRLASPWQVDMLVLLYYPPCGLAPYLTQLQPRLVVISPSLLPWQRKQAHALLTQEAIPWHDLQQQGGKVVDSAL